MPKLRNPLPVTHPDVVFQEKPTQFTPQEVARATTLFNADYLLAAGVAREVIENLLSKGGIDPAEYFGPAPEPVVRLATEADEAALMAFCRVMHADNGLCSFCEAKVENFIQDATRKRGAVLGVIDGPSGFEASVYLTLGQVYYSEDWILSERWLFVHPDHRDKGHVDRLIAYARSCQIAMSKDGPFMPLMLGIVTKNRVDAKIRLWRKKFPLVGATFAWTEPDSIPSET